MNVSGKMSVKATIYMQLEITVGGMVTPKKLIT